ncbi:MAG: homoserine kinase [Nocardioidaceae bacterium]|nr:homoserine kinase [Nocardioidaceae bacterium]
MTRTEFVAGNVTVRAPATSANLGPGFDSLGLSLELYDEVQASVASSAVPVEISGEGQDILPRDERHLVLRAMRATFDFLRAPQPGLQVKCRNFVPQARGLGSSSAAIVAGLRLAEGLVDGASLSAAEALELAIELEGHPDNVAACLFGQLTVAWVAEGGESGTAGAVSLAVNPLVRPVLFIPPDPMPTEASRRLLPETVGHGEAARNSGRAALLVAALTMHPDKLFVATEDRLHQEFRRSAMPESLHLVDQLRAVGEAAVLSGAGPTVLALSTAAKPIDLSGWCPAGWGVAELAVDLRGAHLV